MLNEISHKETDKYCIFSLNNKINELTQQNWTSLVAQMIKNLPAKQKTHNAEDPGLILGLGRILREGIGYPLQRDLVSALNSIH